MVEEARRRRIGRPGVGGLDGDEGAAAEGRGDVVDVRDAQQAGDGGQLDGRDPGPVAPAPQDLVGALDRPQHRAGVELGDRMEEQLDRHHDAELLAATPEGVEEVGLAGEVGADELAVGGDELDGRDAVAREAVEAGEPADAAVEGVGDHRRVAAHRGEGGEPVLGGGERDVAPEGARLDACAPEKRVDLNAVQRGRADHDRARSVRLRVARALHDDASPLVAGLANGVHGVLGAVESTTVVVAAVERLAVVLMVGTLPGRALRFGCPTIAARCKVRRRRPQGRSKVRRATIRPCPVSSCASAAVASRRSSPDELVTAMQRHLEASHPQIAGAAAAERPARDGRVRRVDATPNAPANGPPRRWRGRMKTLLATSALDRLPRRSSLDRRRRRRTAAPPTPSASSRSSSGRPRRSSPPPARARCPRQAAGEEAGLRVRWASCSCGSPGTTFTAATN